MLCTIAAVKGFVFVQDVVKGGSLCFAFYAELGKGSVEAIGELLGLKANEQEHFLTLIDDGCTQEHASTRSMSNFDLTLSRRAPTVELRYY